MSPDLPQKFLEMLYRVELGVVGLVVNDAGFTEELRVSVALTPEKQ